jgi:hypothetical protein
MWVYIEGMYCIVPYVHRASSESSGMGDLVRGTQKGVWGTEPRAELAGRVAKPDNCQKGWWDRNSWRIIGGRRCNSGTYDQNAI